MHVHVRVLEHRCTEVERRKLLLLLRLLRLLRLRRLRRLQSQRDTEWQWWLRLLLSRLLQAVGNFEPSK